METTEIVKRTSKTSGKVRLRFRLRDGAAFKSYLYYKSELNVDYEDLFRLEKDGTFVKNVRKISPELVKTQKEIMNVMAAMKRAYTKMKHDSVEPQSDVFECFVNAELHPEIIETENKVGVVDALEKYIEMKNVSIGTKSHYQVLLRAIQRFEVYSHLTLTFDLLTPETLRKFENYLKNEHFLFENPVETGRSLKQISGKPTMSDVKKVVPDTRKPIERGQNTIHNFMKWFRTFVRWANGHDKDCKIDKPYMNNDPFDNYRVVPEQPYGTPFYLTIEERNKLYEAEMPERLKKQRDIFVFQCVIGCRVSDLWAMTKANIINGGIEYIARKTKEKNPETTRVILNKVALEILDRYKDYDGATLFPFTSQQHYNLDIKEMIRLAGIDRMVTVLNPLTGKEEKRPIYEVASSHMARRTFIGNLYKKVKDPNLIGSMTGHVEGSRSFARYRDIDDDVKKETVMLLE